MAETLSRGESLSPAQRSSMILEKYTGGGDPDKIALLEAAGRATITDFKRSGLVYGLYNAEQLTALESELARREMQPRPSERKNSIVHYQQESSTVPTNRYNMELKNNL